LANNSLLHLNGYNPGLHPFFTFIVSDVNNMLVVSRPLSLGSRLNPIPIKDEVPSIPPM